MLLPATLGSAASGVPIISGTLRGDVPVLLGRVVLNGFAVQRPSVLPSFDVPITGARYKGMFPCFFHGFSSRLFWSMSKALITLARVSRGSITSST